MKALLIALLLPLAAASAQPPAPTRLPSRDLRQLLQDGLFEEEANRNLEKAAAAYETLRDAFEQQRQYAATALFRLAEVRAKQNRKDDAIALYQRVITEFRDDQLTKLSRERLATLGGAAPADGAPSIADEEAAEIARLRTLVKDSPDLLNAADADRVTPLGRAVKEGWLKAAAFLLDNGAKIGNVSGSSALHEAAMRGRKAMVEFLLERGADVNSKDQSGDTPLVAAVGHSRHEVAKVLLEHGADPNSRNREDHSPLHFACERGDLELLKLFLEKSKTLNAISNNQPTLGDSQIAGTPLMNAVRNRKDAVAKLLIERGADVNVEAPAGVSALSIAASANDLEMAALLLENRANARVPGMLISAVRHGRAELASLLIKHGANVNETDQKVGPPLQLAVATSMEITKLLLDAGADPNATDANGYSPLHQVVITGDWQNSGNAQPPTAIRNRARIPVPDGSRRVRVINSGPEPSPSEPRPKPFEVLKLLVEKGAKVNAQDINGSSVLLTAMGSPIPDDVIEWLLEKGADPLAKNKFEQTPITAASNMERRVWLEQRALYSQWVKDGNVAAVCRTAGYTFGAEPFSISPVADFDYPPTAAELLRKMVAGAERNMVFPAEFEVCVYRPNKAGAFDQISRTKVSIQSVPQSSARLPQLQWKDVVVVFREGTGGSTVPMDQFRSFGMETSVDQAPKISIAIGDRMGEARLLGEAHNWSPVNGAVPRWELSDLVTRVIAGEPRADLSSIKLRRTTGGEQKEWTINLQSPVPTAAIRSIPARLADGDSISIPLVPANEATALSQRRIGIFRAAPGRIFGERIFQLAEPDNAPRTLGDFLVEAYISSPMVIPNPDLARVKIHRLKNDQGEEETVEIDYATRVNQVTARTSEEDARKLDVPLQPGDIVEIPVATEPPVDQWKGLPGQLRLFLGKAVTRRIVARQPSGQEETFTLAPTFRHFGIRSRIGEVLEWIADHQSPPFRAMSAVKSGKNLLKVRIRSRGKSTDYTPESILSVNPWLLDGDQVEIERF